MTIIKSAGDSFKYQKSGPYQDKSKPGDIRNSNIVAAKGMFSKISLQFVHNPLPTLLLPVPTLGDSYFTVLFNVLFSYSSAVSAAVRTSLGPRGMDKMVCLVN